jgi:hypothetical protein
MCSKPHTKTDRTRVAAEPGFAALRHSDLPTLDIGSAAGSEARSDPNRRAMAMNLFGSAQDPWTWQGVLLTIAVVLVVLAIANYGVVQNVPFSR